MRLIRNVALLCVGLLMLPAFNHARAADMPVKNDPRPPIYNTSWTGPIIGGTIGIQQGKSNTNVDGWTDKNPVVSCYKPKQYEVAKDVIWSEEEYCKTSKHKYVSQSYPGASSDGNVIGLRFGAYAGYNYQFNTMWVTGVELGGGKSFARDNTQIYATNAKHALPWDLDLTAKLGVLFTQARTTMAYVKGGLKVQNQHSELQGPSGVASEDKTKAGWTAAFGVEHKVDKALFRIETAYSHVSDQTVCIPGACSTLKGGSWQVLAGLGWALN